MSTGPVQMVEGWFRALARLSEERFYLVTLLVMAVAAAALMANFGIDLNGNFLTIQCDTGEFQNAIFNTLHGRWFRNTVYDGPNVLGIHSLFIFLPLALIYGLFPAPETLFNLQIWSVYSTPVPIYLVALELTRRPSTAFLVACSALLSPLLVHMALAPFHPETWITAAIFWSYYFYRRNRTVAFWIAFGIALTSGEEAAFIYIPLGLVLLFFEKDIAWSRRYGWWMTGIGLIWLILSIGIIAPLMHTPGQQNLVAHHYEQWDVKSGGGLFLTLATHPLEAIATMLSFQYVATLIGPPLFLMFLSRASLVLALPLPIYFLMCDREFYLYFHAYYFQFAFTAGYMGLILFLARRDITTHLGALVLIATFFFTLLTFLPAMGLYQAFYVGRDEAFSQTLRETFAKIPTEAGVFGPHRYSGYLSVRENMVMADLRYPNVDFDAWMEQLYPTTDVHADQIDYIVSDLINDQCGWRQGGYNPDLTQKRTDAIKHLIESGQWQLYWSQDKVVILKRVRKS